MIWVYTVCQALSVQKLRNITVLLKSTKLPNRCWTKTKWLQTTHHFYKYMDRVKRIWYLSSMRAAKVQEPPLLAHRSSESRGTFRQKVRSLAPLNGWACAVKICHDRMLEDTNSLDGAHIYRHSQILWHADNIRMDHFNTMFHFMNYQIKIWKSHTNLSQSTYSHKIKFWDQAYTHGSQVCCLVSYKLLSFSLYFNGNFRIMWWFCHMMNYEPVGQLRCVFGDKKR